MKKEIAEELLKIRAVYLQPNDPFTWSSGMKSPIYCDNRLTLSYPETRQKIAKGLAELIKTNYPEAEILAGTATAGIPHAAWVSDVLNLPMCYVRSKAKEHGKGNQIEGKIAEGAKVVVIEDLISTGGSAITAAEALREAGCDVLGVAAIFTYGLPKGDSRLAEAQLQAASLSDYDALIEVAAEKEYVEASDIETLKQWKQNPDAWGTK
ncbi:MULTISPECIES: orotate phosphoribosyltransferase [Bacillaceae]|uniref:Orotate phosphoribosyltransferase n=1 Tax=Domibacillus aminovorans TaxID=29332 RepID=A0A177LA25_9BACI|nr:MULTISPECIES: orotate phosphoribosyltransferase [Bacillaceae]OAH53709.1 orotate phosphoribosyltransferase [Domibacillus aminovorans]OAH62142.1 orotate phosphoribosyltransferase [Domibacillus aminovorans]